MNKVQKITFKDFLTKVAVKEGFMTEPDAVLNLDLVKQLGLLSLTGTVNQFKVLNNVIIDWTALNLSLEAIKGEGYFSFKNKSEFDVDEEDKETKPYEWDA